MAAATGRDPDLRFRFSHFRVTTRDIRPACRSSNTWKHIRTYRGYHVSPTGMLRDIAREARQIRGAIARRMPGEGNGRPITRASRSSGLRSMRALSGPVPSAFSVLPMKLRGRRQHRIQDLLIRRAVLSQEVDVLPANVVGQFPYLVVGLTGGSLCEQPLPLQCVSGRSV
jgi:hypothetical protein